MSRPLRIQFPDAWYHVMNRGRRGAIFRGKEFAMNRFSSVSSVVERMKVKISKSRQLRRRVEELKAAVYMSQE